MKKLLLLFATLITLTAKSQTFVYHPFPEDTATWLTDKFSNMCSGYCSSVFYEMKGDTIINSKSYNKIYIRNGLFYYINPNPDYAASFAACSYTGAIRQDSVGKKVYFIDSTMTTDTLLYDFNLTVGDTIQSWYSRGNIPQPLVVSGIDSVFINSSYHKVFNFSNFTPHSSLSLIEGVGWTGDLLFGILVSGDGATSLACFDGNTIVGGAFINECSFSLECSISVGINEQHERKDLSVFPNPFSDKLNFAINNNELSEIILYDITSRKILQQKFTNSVSLNTEQLAKGLYLYEMKSKDGLWKNGKVVKD